jgi:hypothetical protein
VEPPADELTFLLQAQVMDLDLPVEPQQAKLIPALHELDPLHLAEPLTGQALLDPLLQLLGTDCRQRTAFLGHIPSLLTLLSPPLHPPAAGTSVRLGPLVLQRRGQVLALLDVETGVEVVRLAGNLGRLQS